MATHSRCHKGFTLVELLVVVVIITVLVALLFPAVQAVRDSARSAQCKNNLKQLTLGLLQHEERHECLPFGGWGSHWIGEPERGTMGGQPGGWGFNVLAFIEQETVRNSGRDLPDDQRNQAIVERTQVAMSQFTCPSRRRVQSYMDHNLDYYRTASGTNLTISTGARTDYAANSGDQERELLMDLPDFGDVADKTDGPTAFSGGASSPAAYAKKTDTDDSQGDSAQITVDFADDCSSIDVTSTKDLSNVVIQFADESYQKFDGLSGRTQTFRGDDGKNIVRAWIKSGTNDSGDCPGCGERFTNANCVTHDIDDDVQQPETIDEGDSNFPWEETTGVIGQHFGAKQAGIADGTSNTYIIGEKYIDADQYASGYDAGDNKNLYVGFSNDTHRWTFSPPQRDQSGVTNQFVFGSAHAGTWNVAFSDGSVRAMGFEIDPQIHRFLGNRNDGQRIPQHKW